MEILNISAVMHVSHFCSELTVIPQCRSCAREKNQRCPRRRPHCPQPGCHAPRRETWTHRKAIKHFEDTNPFGASLH